MREKGRAVLARVVNVAEVDSDNFELCTTRDPGTAAYVFHSFTFLSPALPLSLVFLLLSCRSHHSLSSLLPLSRPFWPRQQKYVAHGQVGTRAVRTFHSLVGPRHASPFPCSFSSFAAHSPFSVSVPPPPDPHTASRFPFHHSIPNSPLSDRLFQSTLTLPLMPSNLSMPVPS